jgi:RNA polymerase sigma factor (sigma-70 family)
MTENTPYSIYSLELDRKPYEALSNAALAGLLGEAINGSQEAWQRLWGHGLRMVLKIVNHMEEKGLLKNIDREEAIAEGNLAIGEALLSWLPKKGKYSTWIWLGIRAAIVRADRADFNLDLYADVDELLGDDDALDGVYFHGQSVRKLRRAFRHLSNLHKQVVTMYFWGDYTQAEIGEVLGVTRQRVNQLLSVALTELYDIMNDLPPDHE